MRKRNGETLREREERMGRRKGTREGLKKRKKEIKRKRATPREGEGKEMREKEKKKAIKRKIKRTRESSFVSVSAVLCVAFNVCRACAPFSCSISLTGRGISRAP